MIVSIVAMAKDNISGPLFQQQRQLAYEFRRSCPIRQHNRFHIETDGVPRRAA